MSQAFEEFVSQYKMTGSEKAGGYSRSAFVGLSEAEKSIVFDLLVSELPWQVKWLFFVDPRKAADIAREKEAEQRGNPYAHVYMFQEQLVNQCGELIYQEHMIEDYKNYTDYLKPSVLRAIVRTPTTDSTINLFKEVILVEVDEKAASTASNYFLESSGFTRNTEADKILYNLLLAGLASENLSKKVAAIDYILTNKKQSH